MFKRRYIRIDRSIWNSNSSRTRSNKEINGYD